jgi:hypothetical protein
VYKCVTGKSYKGEYKQDQRYGKGEMKWQDGSLYAGSWVKGLQHGLGKMKFPDGSVKEG